MDLKIKEPKEHSYRIIAVPSEKLKGQKTSDIKNLISDTKVFKIHSRMNVKKGEIFPYSHFLLATGSEVDEDMVWKVYNNSDFIVFFFVERVNND